MGWDTIQLENSISTISQEYLLEFNFEYGTPESLHPELSGLEDPIVEFPEGKVGVYTKFLSLQTFGCRNYFLGDDVYPTFLYDDSRANAYMDLFNLISAHNPTKVKTGTRPRAAHKVPLLTTTASRVIDMGDTAMASGSSETPAAIEKSPLDFTDEDPPPLLRVAMKRPRRPFLNRGKSLAAIEIEADSTGFAPATQEPLVNVSDPDPLSRTPVAEDPDSEKSTSFTSMVGLTGNIYQSRWGVTNNCRLDTPAVCQDVVDHISGRGGQECETREGIGKPSRSSDLQVSNDQLFEQVSTLQALISGEERIKAAFDEFKKYEDDRVTSRCAKIDARLDALSIDFDEELYPHMLTAIAGRRWVIGHGLRLVVMKCAESTELRLVFVDVVSVGIAKGMSEGLKHGVEHGKAKVDLAAIEAYDPEADTKYVAALHALKDLKRVILEKMLLKGSVNFELFPTKDPVPTVAPQGLAILLADAATQTYRTEDEASLRLLKSKFVPPMYNLDWL
uniref:Transposase (Putative), gypsy type n=1 Tax=Tanacetum cinerariifolium TaxID=118510 RepID=A0A699GI11_TANCI|nr:hypothetical protein [Tanacetum cinerariifolium]